MTLKPTTKPTTYKLTHPQISSPIEMDDNADRTEPMIKRWAEMYVVLHYGILVEHNDWEIEIIS